MKPPYKVYGETGLTKSVFVFFVAIINYHKLSGLKTIQIYYFIALEVKTLG